MCATYYSAACIYRRLIILVVVFVLAACSTGSSEAEQEFALRFAVAADGHWGQPNTDYAADYARLIATINRLHAEVPFDVIIILGDLVHDQPDLLPQVKNVLDKLHPPYLVVHGNHDHATTELWERVWGYSLNLALPIKGYDFILLNTADSAGTYSCADPVWLRSTLYSAPANGSFVFAHISQSDWTKHGIACPEVMSILTSHDAIRGVFHGHDHDVDDLRQLECTPFVFTGRFGGSWGGTKQFRIVNVTRTGAIFIKPHEID